MLTSFTKRSCCSLWHSVTVGEYLLSAATGTSACRAAPLWIQSVMTLHAMLFNDDFKLNNSVDSEAVRQPATSIWARCRKWTGNVDKVGGARLTGAAEALLADSEQHGVAVVAVGWFVEVLQTPNVLPIFLHVLGRDNTDYRMLTDVQHFTALL